MPWLCFTKDFDFTPAAERRVTIGYRAGMRLCVTTECAVAAIAAKRAKRMKTPPRAVALRILAEQGITNGVDAPRPR